MNFGTRPAVEGPPAAPIQTGDDGDPQPATTPTAPCAEAPVGGFVFVPGSNNTLATVYAVHTITGQTGQFFITFSGVYNLGPDTADLASMQGAGTWLITGATGGYTGIQGQGTWKADASLLAKGQPYIRHTETGRISWSK